MPPAQHFLLREFLIRALVNFPTGVLSHFVLERGL
jgi:hypothetical protein